MSPSVAQLFPFFTKYTLDWIDSSLVKGVYQRRGGLLYVIFVKRVLCIDVHEQESLVNHGAVNHQRPRTNAIN